MHVPHASVRYVCCAVPFRKAAHSLEAAVSVLILAEKLPKNSAVLISMIMRRQMSVGACHSLNFQAKQARLKIHVVRRLPTVGEESEAPGSDGDAGAGQQLEGRDVDGDSDLLHALTKGSSKR